MDKRIIAGLFSVVLLLAGNGFAGEDGAAPGDGAKKTVKFPFVEIDREAGEVRVEAELSPDITGMFAALEFLLIAGQQNPEDQKWYYDRAYESVFVTKANPNHIHVGLMLAGMKPGPLPQEAPEGYSKDNADRLQGEKVGNGAAPVAAMVDILVEWEQNGARQRMRAEKFLHDRESKGNAADTAWAFTGSFFVNNDEGKADLAANQTHVIAAVFYDQSSIFNLPYFAKNAHWNPEVGLELSAEKLPPFFRKAKTIVEGTEKRKIWVPDHHAVTLVLKASDRKIPVPEIKKPAQENAGEKPEEKKAPEEKAAE